MVSRDEVLEFLIKFGNELSLRALMKSVVCKPVTLSTQHTHISHMGPIQYICCSVNQVNEISDPPLAKKPKPPVLYKSF